MNVIGARPDGWWRDRTGAAVRLAGRLRLMAADTHDEVWLVLDGRPSARLPEETVEGVRIIYAARRGPNAADDRIVELLSGLDTPEEATVFTSDRELGERARERGATVRGASALLELLDRADREADAEREERPG